MFRTTTAIVTLTAIMGAPAALAGNMEEAAPEPVVAAPAPVVQSSPDWTGFYGGAQLGYANVDADGFDDDDSLIGGLTGGYDYDFQNGFVAGAGLDYDFLDADVGNAGSVEDVFRAKLRGGYKIGQGLAYATGGYAWADTDNLGDDDGYFIGAGYEHLVTESISVGGEVLYHQFDDFGNTNADVDATTAQARVTFRF